ncbi:hypothetical protein [Parafrankia sp. CH37]|nr:hypothetical protein [Parafrankia sp. CH37]
MSRVMAVLAAVPALLVGGLLTVAFLLPDDQLYLLGPLIAGTVILAMFTVFALAPRLLRWRLAELFGREGSRVPGMGPMPVAGRPGSPATGFSFFFGNGAGNGPMWFDGAGAAGDPHEPWRGWHPHGDARGDQPWCHTDGGHGHSGYSGHAGHPGHHDQHPWGTDSWSGSYSHGGAADSCSSASSSHGSDGSWSSGSSDSSSSSSSSDGGSSSSSSFDSSSSGSSW